MYYTLLAVYQCRTDGDWWIQFNLVHAARSPPAVLMTPAQCHELWLRAVGLYAPLHSPVQKSQLDPQLWQALPSTVATPAGGLVRFLVRTPSCRGTSLALQASVARLIAALHGPITLHKDILLLCNIDW